MAPRKCVKRSKSTIKVPRDIDIVYVDIIECFVSIAVTEREVWKLHNYSLSYNIVWIIFFMIANYDNYLYNYW